MRSGSVTFYLYPIIFNKQAIGKERRKGKKKRHRKRKEREVFKKNKKEFILKKKELRFIVCGD